MKDRVLHANVEYVSPLTDSVLQFILRPDNYVDYTAGQYLKLILDKQFYCYSIANAPLGSQRYELHIRHSKDNENNKKLLTFMKKQGGINLQVPFGECSIDKLYPSMPIIFIAAGSGFAPIKAMLEQLFADSDPRPIKLYWGVRVLSDLYMMEKLSHWQSSIRSFSYSSHISSSDDDSLIAKIFKQHADDLQNYQIIMSGPFDLMYKIKDALLAASIQEKYLFSDAFSFC